MKKLLLGIGLCLLATPTFAQINEPGWECYVPQGSTVTRTFWPDSQYRFSASHGIVTIYDILQSSFVSDKAVAMYYAVPCVHRIGHQ